MTPEQLAEYLGLAACAPAVREKILNGLTPEDLRKFEKMREVEEDIRLWRQGVKPLPPGVIVCERRGNRGPAG